MFDDADYRIAGKMEIYFQNAIYLIFKLMEFHVEVERTTSHGRVDVVLKTEDYVYVMELKLDGSAQEALQQIETKGYAEPFKMDKRKLYRIGVNFSSESRGIAGWLIESGCKVYFHFLVRKRCSFVVLHYLWLHKFKIRKETTTTFEKHKQRLFESLKRTIDLWRKSNHWQT